MDADLKQYLEAMEGRLVEKMSKNPPPVFAQNRLNKFFQALAFQGWFVEQDQPVTLGEMFGA